MIKPIHLQFSYVCSFRFADLAGTDAVRRHCGVCKLDVINLDALPEDEQQAVLQRAGTERICVSATTWVSGACPSSPHQHPAYVNTVQVLAGAPIAPIGHMPDLK